MAEFLRNTGLIKLRRAHEGTATSEDRNERKGIDLLWEYETDPVSFINIYKVIKNKKGGRKENTHQQMKHIKTLSLKLAF